MLISHVAIFLILSLHGTAPCHASGSYRANVTLLKNSEYVDALAKGVRDARKNVLFSFYLFKINRSPGSLPGRVADELVKAGKRGVDVTVILEISDDADDPLNRENRKTAAFLAGKGIRVLFDSPRTKAHLKVALIDERYVFFGSHNLTQSALKYNNEISALVDSPELASELKTYINGYVASRRCSAPEGVKVLE